MSAGLLAWTGCNGSTKPKADGETADHDGHDHKGHEHKDHDHADHDHQDHDKHEADHPKSYGEAVTKLAELRTEVRDSLKANAKDKADDAVHALGHVLERIPGLAEASSMSDEALADVKESVELLLDFFAKIDDELHGGTASSYEDLSDKIDGLINRLKQRVKP